MWFVCSFVCVSETVRFTYTDHLGDTQQCRLSRTNSNVTIEALYNDDVFVCAACTTLVFIAHYFFMDFWNRLFCDPSSHSPHWRNLAWFSQKRILLKTLDSILVSIILPFLRKKKCNIAKRCLDFMFGFFTKKNSRILIEIIFFLCLDIF